MTDRHELSDTGLFVRELWRFPVKSLQGEAVDEADVTRLGVDGDRAWSILDAESGVSLTARRTPELLTAQARLAGPDRVVIRLPDGTETDSEAGADDALSRWLGRPVRLEPAAADSVGTYETQADETERGPWYRWTGPEGSFHDSTRLSLVSQTTLGSWNRRRFRMNVVADGDGEDQLVGRSLMIGSVRAAVTKHIDRCVMVTRPQPAAGGEPALDRNVDVLGAINRDRGGQLGVGLLIAAPGTIRGGDRIHIAG